MRRSVEVLMTVIMAAILLSTIATAKQATNASQSGTAADFTATFPWVVVALVTLLFVIIAWFIKRYDEAREKKIDSLVNEITATNESLAKATAKLDATINTLFERDRDNERVMSDHGAAIAAIQATCAARGRMCRLLYGEKMDCLDRRDGEERRGD